MEKSTKGKICFKLIFFPNVVVLFSIFLLFPASQSFHFLFTVPFLLLSAVFLVTLIKKKGFPHENLVPEKLQKEELKQLLADVTQTEATQQSEAAQMQEQQIESRPDSSLPSDNESSNGSIMGENVELNLLKHGQLQRNLESDSSIQSESESCAGSTMDESFDPDRNKDKNLGISDSDINLIFDSDNDNDDDEDEDSLIEIDLPIDDFSGFSEESKDKLLSKIPDFLPETIFEQQGLVELLAEINEMNEDENLIEIDISMGSTRSQDQKLIQKVAVLGDV